MSKCRTCEYALYDGMCLAQGKFTLLDAPACDGYKPRIDVEVSQLKAENAKLREQVFNWKRNWESEHDYADQMEAKERRAVAENAKLRELVRAFDWCTENFDMPNKCERCPLSQSSALEPECEIRMRELGIEVKDE